MIIAAVAFNVRDAGPLAAAGSLAKRLGEPLVLVHAFPLLERADETHGERRALAAKQLLGLAEELRREGIDVGPELLDGEVVAAIHDCASRLRPRLVIIGGRDGEAYQGTNRVADRLSRVLPCAFLVTGKQGALVDHSRPSQRLRALVALDRTAASDAAIAELQDLRRSIALDCDVITFYWPPEEQSRLKLPRALTLAADPIVEGELVGEAQRRLGELPGQGDVTFNAAPLFGTLGLHITAEATKRNADFILVGSHQRSAVAGVFHGSVTQQLLRDAALPVLFAPLAAREPRGKVTEPRRILVATDLTDFGNRAISFAYTYFRNYAGTVDILHILDTPSEQRLRAMLDRAGKALGKSTDLATSMLQSLIPPSAEAYELSSEIHVAAGEEVARQINEHAKATKADVICIATHGAGQLRVAIAGSVANELVQGAERPLFLVR